MQYLQILLVYDEEMKGDIHDYSLQPLLLTCQPTKVKVATDLCSRSGVNVQAHLLRQNFSRNYSSVQSGPPLLLKLYHSDSLLPKTKTCGEMAIIYHFPPIFFLLFELGIFVLK